MAISTLSLTPSHTLKDESTPLNQSTKAPTLLYKPSFTPPLLLLLPQPHFCFFSSSCRCCFCFLSSFYFLRFGSPTLLYLPQQLYI